MSHVPAARRAADEAGSAVIEVYCPVPLVVHPAGAGAVDAFAVDWLVDRGLFDRSSRIARTNLGWLIAAAVPFTSEEFVKAFTAYGYWAFAWDDHLDRPAEDPAGLMAHVGEVVRALTAPSGTPADDNPWANGTRAVRDLLFDCLPPEARTDFLHANTHWITGELWERAVQLRDRPPDLGEHLRMRWANATGGRPLRRRTAPVDPRRAPLHRHQRPLPPPRGAHPGHPGHPGELGPHRPDPAGPPPDQLVVGPAGLTARGVGPGRHGRGAPVIAAAARVRGSGTR